jgi:hypothetical protein
VPLAVRISILRSFDPAIRFKSQDTFVNQRSGQPPQHPVTPKLATPRRNLKKAR